MTAAADQPLTEAFDGFVIDLDGVVYVGSRGVRGAADATNALIATGKPVVFVTNDPRGARSTYQDRLQALNIPTDIDNILTSGAALAQHVVSRAPSGRIYAIGSQELKAELAAAGVVLLQGDHGSGADTVVVGGHEDFDYQELRIAVQAVLRGADLYATNRDRTFPMPDGPWPATGAILAAVEAATGVSAVVVGKPSPVLFDLARERMPLAERVAIVGDHLETHIAGGHAAGLTTVLVLSGSTHAHDVPGAPVTPDYVLEDLTGLLQPPSE